MKMRDCCIIVLAGMFVFAGCRKEDIRTVTVSVPELRNTACAKIIGDSLSKQMGVKPEKLKFDLTSRTVDVTYDSIFIARKNIEFAIADAGFKANEVPANTNAAAALPPECFE